MLETSFKNVLLTFMILKLEVCWQVQLKDLFLLLLKSPPNQLIGVGLFSGDVVVVFVACELIISNWSCSSAFSLGLQLYECGRE